MMSPVFWRHASKRTVCLPKECVYAETYSSTQLLRRGKSQHLPTHKASSQILPASPPLPPAAAYSKHSQMTSSGKEKKGMGL
jgi:hypothetical protein